MTAAPALSIVVPTYNERANILALLDALATHAPQPYEMVLVDDASPDGTADAAEASGHRVHVVRRPGKAGIGSAYRDGFRATRGDVVVQMDADLSHDPRDLPALVSAVRAGAALAIGSRYVAGGAVEGWGPLRRATSRGANRLARAALELPVRDATSGYRAWSREHAGIVARTTTDGYAFQVETLHLASRAGVRIVEVPIRFVDRRRGTSKLGPSEVARFARTVFALRRRAGTS